MPLSWIVCIASLPVQRAEVLMISIEVEVSLALVTHLAPDTHTHTHAVRTRRERKRKSALTLCVTHKALLVSSGYWYQVREGPGYT